MVNTDSGRNHSNNFITMKKQVMGKLVGREESRMEKEKSFDFLAADAVGEEAEVDLIVV